LDTKPQIPQSQSLSSNALIKPTPAQGFSILYHATTNILLDLPTAVVKVYLAVTTLAAGKREQPSCPAKASAMSGISCHQKWRCLKILLSIPLLPYTPQFPALMLRSHHLCHHRHPLRLQRPRQMGLARVGSFHRETIGPTTPRH
jgi:hypothetical protein